MILKKLTIYSFKEKKVLNEYIFNKIGINIILGEKKDENNEANGVGKTTMVECLSFLLGEKINTYYRNNKILLNKEILIILEVDVNGSTCFLARHFISPDKGYILYDNNINFDLKNWKEYKDIEYKNKIHKKILGNDINDITFASLREFIIRDEQNGFIKNSIGIANRNAVNQHKILAFLCNLPYNAESEIKNITKKISELKEKQRLLTASIGKSVSELKSEKAKYEKQIRKIEKDIESININKQYNFKSSEYIKNKEELNKIQNKIFKLQHIKKQYQQNIENLKQKVEDIKLLKDIAPFYKQLIGWFPKEIVHNYDQIKQFYDFMIENRGNYFKEKILSIDAELTRLDQKKLYIQKKLEENYKILKNSSLLEDINSIIYDRENLNTKIAELNLQLDNYERLKELTNDINSLNSDRLLLVQKKTDEFNSHKEHIRNLEKIFQSLSELAYDTTGGFDVEFDNVVNDKKNSTTGRIKIECTLPDDRSHGINYMKINMFDLTWFLASLENKEGHNITFLIHDGSYSKPDPSVKAKILKHVDERLKKIGKGQYFVTINKHELLKEDLDYFEKNGNVIAKLERTKDDKKRFFGFKLY